MNKPEVQIHVAATAVKGGDPFGITREEIEDKKHEICQFALRLPPKFFGNTTKSHIHDIFLRLEDSVVKELRKVGFLRPGE